MLLIELEEDALDADTLDVDTLLLLELIVILELELELAALLELFELILDDDELAAELALLDDDLLDDEIPLLLLEEMDWLVSAAEFPEQAVIVPAITTNASHRPQRKKTCWNFIDASKISRVLNATTCSKLIHQNTSAFTVAVWMHI